MYSQYFRIKVLIVCLLVLQHDDYAIQNSTTISFLHPHLLNYGEAGFISSAGKL